MLGYMGVIAGQADESRSPEEERRAAFERGMKALNRRMYTVAGMRDLLTETGFAEAAVEGAIADLAGFEVLDDAKYAIAYAHDKRELGGWGAQRIAETLRRKGVGAAEIEAALAGDTRDDQLSRALELLRRRNRDIGDEAARARELAFLVRRGYELELAYEAVRHYEKQ